MICLVFFCLLIFCLQQDGVSPVQTAKRTLAFPPGIKERTVRNGAKKRQPSLDDVERNLEDAGRHPPNHSPMIISRMAKRKWQWDPHSLNRGAKKRRPSLDDADSNSEVGGRHPPQHPPFRVNSRGTKEGSAVKHKANNTGRASGASGMLSIKNETNGNETVAVKHESNKTAQATLSAGTASLKSETNGIETVAVKHESYAFGTVSIKSETNGIETGDAKNGSKNQTASTSHAVGATAALKTEPNRIPVGLAVLPRQGPKTTTANSNGLLEIAEAERAAIASENVAAEAEAELIASEAEQEIADGKNAAVTRRSARKKFPRNFYSPGRTAAGKWKNLMEVLPPPFIDTNPRGSDSDQDSTISNDISPYSQVHGRARRPPHAARRTSATTTSMISLFSTNIDSVGCSDFGRYGYEHNCNCKTSEVVPLIKNVPQVVAEDEDRGFAQKRAVVDTNCTHVDMMKTVGKMYEENSGSKDWQAALHALNYTTQIVLPRARLEIDNIRVDAKKHLLRNNIRDPRSIGTDGDSIQWENGARDMFVQIAIRLSTVAGALMKCCSKKKNDQFNQFGTNLMMIKDSRVGGQICQVCGKILHK